MAKKNEHALTKEGIEKLNQELSYLKNVERLRIVDEIKAAREQGDLSENADYDAARDEQARIEAKIAELERILKNAIEIKKDTTEVVTVGKLVTFRYLDDNKEATYTLVGPYEVNLKEKKISIDSPIGKALKNNKKGDVVTVKTETKKEFKIEILDITHSI